MYLYQIAQAVSIYNTKISKFCIKNQYFTFLPVISFASASLQ